MTRKGENHRCVFNVIEILNLFPNSTPFVIFEPKPSQIDDDVIWSDEEVLNNEKGFVTMPLLKYGLREVGWLNLRGNCLELHLSREL